MNLIDRIHIRWAAARYDFWLDIEGVRGRRRRELRRELQANLRDAAVDRGGRSAVRALGPLPALAHASAGDASRPRWTVGGFWAGIAFGTLMLGWLLSTFAFLDGVMASGVTDRDVTGTVFPWGQELTARVESEGGGLSVGGVFPWAPLVLAVLVFAVASRPWRLVTGRRGAVVATN